MSAPWEKYQSSSQQTQADGPWSKYNQTEDVVDTPSKKESNAASAALEGFGEGATLGYLNNLQAALEKPAFAVFNKIHGTDTQADDYTTARDYYNKRQENLKKENPGAFASGQIAGSIASSVPVAKAAQGATALARATQAAKAGAIYGSLQNTNTDEVAGEIEGLDLGQRILNAGSGAAIGAGASLGADAVSKGISSGAKYVGNKLQKSAEKLAENATGATRVQSEKFSDDAGRYLLDNKIVKFGDTPEKVAARANKAIKASEDTIDASLKTLDDKGVKVSQDKIIESLQSRIKELKSDPSQAGLVKNLEGKLDDIINTGNSEVLPSFAEKTKRGFNKSANQWDNPNGSVGKEADKILYRAYRDAVEDVAKSTDEIVANQFKQAKQTYGKLNPIASAAEKRAAQLSQSPKGGFLDVTSAVAGTAAGDPTFGVASIAARRLIAPRISSSMAVTADQVSKKLLSIPQYASLAETNPSVFKAFATGIFNDIKDYSQLKGIEKFTQDGADNLIENAGFTKDEVDKLKASKKGQEALIEASSLKSTDSIKKRAAKIRSSLLQESDGQ